VISQATVYVHAIAMLHDRLDAVAGDLARWPSDEGLQQQQAGLNRSLRLFRARLRRTEEAELLSVRRA
jgi:hypothetical protein